MLFHILQNFQAAKFLLALRVLVLFLVMNCFVQIVELSWEIVWKHRVFNVGEKRRDRRLLDDIVGFILSENLATVCLQDSELCDATPQVANGQFLFGANMQVSQTIELTWSHTHSHASIVKKFFRNFFTHMYIGLALKKKENLALVASPFRLT